MFYAVIVSVFYCSKDSEVIRNSGKHLPTIMTTEDIWTKFLPKIRTRNYNSSLSQMSTISTFSRDGRLSISSTANAVNSSKVLRTPAETVATPRRPSTSKNSFSWGTPQSKKTNNRTPLSSNRKRSSKNSTPTDGLKQKNLLSYFPVSEKKRSEPSKVKEPEVLEISSDSENDEESTVMRNKSNEKSSQVRSLNFSGVVRKLFPSNSAADNDVSAETLNETLKCITVEDKNKENHITLSATLSVQSENATESVSEVLPTFKFKKKELKSNKLLNSYSTHEGSQRCKPSKPTITEHPVTLVNREVPKSSVGPNLTTSPVPLASKYLRNVDKNLENKKNVLGNYDKGKGRVKTSEESRTFSSTETSTVEHATGNVCSDFIRREKSSHSMPLADITHSTKECCHLSGQSSGIGKHSNGCELIENFTGVTEHVSVPSSGEQWTPGQFSSSSSFEQDDSYLRKKGRNVKKKNKTTQKKNIGSGSRVDPSSRVRKCVQKNYKSSSVSRAKSNSTKETPHCSGTIHNGASTDGDVEEASLCNIQSKEKISEGSSSEQKSFSNSGGFFTDDKDLERPMGQSFVIRYPSVEYLLNYESVLENSSILIERSDTGSDEESEKSSVVADICAAVTINNTSLSKKTVAATDVPSEGTLSPSIVLVDEIRPIVNSQDSLKGVTLTESEWNNLPSQAQGNNMFITNTYKDKRRVENVASSPVACVSNNSIQSNSHPSKSDINKVIHPSHGLRTERPVSPNEGEEAPFNSLIVSRRQSAYHPGVSNEAIMSPHSFGMSSVSTEICISSAIVPDGNPHLVQNVSPDKEDSAERLAINQRVHEWVSNIIQHDMNDGTRSHVISTKSREVDSIRKHSNGSQVAAPCNSNNRIQLKDTRTSMDIDATDTVDDHDNATRKQCSINCQVRGFITASFKSESEIFKLFRKNCDVKSKYSREQKQSKLNKTKASLSIEITNKPDNSFRQPEWRNYKIQQGNSCTRKHHDNTKRLTPHSHDSSTSLESQNVRNILVKAQAKYGKWGWESLEIECLEEGIFEENQIYLSGEKLELSIQKVDVSLCKCSRSLLVECIVVRQKIGNFEIDPVGGSKFYTSLKDFGRRWGVPDNPVNLSAVAYSEISIVSNEKGNNDLNSLNLSTEEEPELCDSLSGTLENPSREIPKIIYNDKVGVPSGEIHPRKLVSTRDFRFSQPVQESSMYSITNFDDGNAAESSDDTGWMTQEGEASKQYAIDQWKDLMTKMRHGRKTSDSSLSRRSVATSSWGGSSCTGSYSASGHQRRAGYTQGRRQRMCPFYKKIEGTSFAVDAFSYGSIPGITHYFLSHFHFDHYVGLDKAFTHPLYCSSVTAKLVALKLKVEPHLVRKIDPGQTVEVDGVRVTALDANHCPGSVMFLFRLPQGRNHLHVGDFRAHPYMESYHAFWNVDIDRLYLDTTYCNPTYTFPSQDRIIQNVLVIVEEALFKNPKTLFVCGSYTIGKERVFAAIVERFKFRVWAAPDKRRVLECVREGLTELACIGQQSLSISDGGAARELDLTNALSVLSKSKEDAQVHVLPMNKMKLECLEDHLFSIKNMTFTNIVAFRPTGWAHGRNKGNSESNVVCNSPTVKIYEVAYSEHSNFMEMKRFVKYIKPKAVIKTVNVASPKQRQAMDVHINAWLKQAHTTILVPSRSNDSPKSSLVAEEQRASGVFEAGKKKNNPERKLSVSQGNDWSQLTSQNSSSLTKCSIDYLDGKREEERSRRRNQMRVPNLKRPVSPVHGKSPYKKCCN